MFIKLVFMIDYVLFHLIQRSYFKYQEEVMTCYDYISILDNHYSIAMYQHTLTHYCYPKINHNINGLQMKSIIHPLLDEEMRLLTQLTFQIIYCSQALMHQENLHL